MTSLTRRNLLLGASAAATLAAAPAIAAAAPAPMPARPMPMWAVGTPDEWDHLPIAAANEEEARRTWVSETVGGWRCEAVEDGEAKYEDPECDCDFCQSFSSAEAQRKPIWDGKSVTPALWLEADLGTSCSRCGYECFAESGAHPVGDEAVCEECMTLADWDVVDPARAAKLRAEAAADV